MPVFSGSDAVEVKFPPKGWMRKGHSEDVPEVKSERTIVNIYKTTDNELYVNVRVETVGQARGYIHADDSVYGVRTLRIRWAEEGVRLGLEGLPDVPMPWSPPPVNLNP